MESHSGWSWARQSIMFTLTGEMLIWHELQQEEWLTYMCLIFQQTVLNYLHGGGCRIQGKGISQCRCTFMLEFMLYFLRNLGQSKSHGQSQIQSWKYTSPLSRRSYKIKWLTTQIWEEFVIIITLVVLQSTTFYVIATFN